MPRWLKWVLIVMGGIAVLAVVLSFFRSADESDQEIKFSEVLAAGRNGDIERIEVYGTSLDITFVGERDEWQSRMGLDTDLVAALEAEGITVGGTDGIEVDFGSTSVGLDGLSPFINFVPLILFVVIFYYSIRNAVREGFRQGVKRDQGTSDG